MPKKYDVIVIGAGNGGLAAAATTAKAGLKTLLIEKNSSPGGSATSFRRGRFEFEPSLHEMAGYGLPDDPGDLQVLFNTLGVDLKLFEVPEAYRYIETSTGVDVVMPTGRKEYIDKMEEYVPGSRESVEKCFAIAEEGLNAMGYLAQGNVDPQVLMTEYPNFMKVTNATLQEVLDLVEMPQKAQMIYTAYWGYLGAPTKMGDFHTFAMMVERYLRYKAWVPKDRSHEMSLAIEKVIRDAGGDIWYNCPVSKVLIEDGAIKGIATEYGEVYADQVISNIIAKKIFGDMVDFDKVPEFEIKRDNARTIGCSAFCVYLGLNKSPEELGITDYSIFLNDNPDSNELYDSFSDTYGNGTVTMNCLNIANPGCSPEGTSILWVTFLCNGAAWTDVSARDYKKAKNEVAMRAIKAYEEATGIIISDCIEEFSVSTPVTFARYLGTPKGSIYGYQDQMWDTILARTMSKAQEQTVKGLIFCGGHATMIHGYSSTYKSGASAGQQAVLAYKEMRGE